MQLTGIHHLSAITAGAPANYAFYTNVMGLRLVKKTVNQDDTTAYHLFYADGLASPGTDLTFFHYPSRPERRGSRSISRTGLRVADRDALGFWAERFAERGVRNSGIIDRDDRGTIDFEDHEGQRFSLVTDTDTSPANPWSGSSVPARYQIRGLGPITMSVQDYKRTEPTLLELMGMRYARNYQAPSSDGTDTQSTVHVYETGPGGASAELHVAHEPHVTPVYPGAGGVHHVAFRVPTYEDYDRWLDRLNTNQVRSSGPVDRFYFRSLYFREPSGILFELATDGPGFTADEPLETLGQKLALPPFLEGNRASIEANLQPLETE